MSNKQICEGRQPLLDLTPENRRKHVFILYCTILPAGTIPGMMMMSSIVSSCLLVEIHQFVFGKINLFKLHQRSRLISLPIRFK